MKFGITFVALLLAAPAYAATFDIVKTQKNGSWEANLYNNRSGNRQFCALESKDKTVAFRVVKYLGDGDTFLEIHNPKWKLIPSSNAKFSIKFTKSAQSITAEMRGARDANGYTHDFLEVDKLESFLNLVGSGSDIEILNSNSSPIAEFRGNGSSPSRVAFEKCVAGAFSGEAQAKTSNGDAGAKPEINTEAKRNVTEAKSADGHETAVDALVAYAQETSIDCFRETKEMKCPIISLTEQEPLVTRGSSVEGKADDTAITFIPYQYDTSGNAVQQMAIVMRKQGERWKVVGRVDETMGHDPRNVEFSDGGISYEGTYVKDGEGRANPTGAKRFRITYSDSGVKFVNP